MLLWWGLVETKSQTITALSILMILVLSKFVVRPRWHIILRPLQLGLSSAHPLLADDRQGFVSDLRLDEKAAIFDGNNIYHFGLDNRLGAKPLSLIAAQLRREGFRVVCFFDANIFYTLKENGAFEDHKKHDIKVITNLFGLRENEIYIVPSGPQADKYILDSLKYLPISFAVTNDKFRDYMSSYKQVLGDNQWRKGLTVSNDELRLFDHRFQNSVRIK